MKEDFILSNREKALVIDCLQYENQRNQVSLKNIPNLTQPVMTNRHKKPTVYFMSVVGFVFNIFSFFNAVVLSTKERYDMSKKEKKTMIQFESEEASEFYKGDSYYLSKDDINDENKSASLDEDIKFKNKEIKLSGGKPKARNTFRSSRR